MITLYGTNTSPYVRHARIALLESGLEWRFEVVGVQSLGVDSPLLRVPFLTDGELELTDSSVIIRYAREKAKQAFLPTIEDHELFCTATTVLDSAVNLFYLQLSEGISVTDVNAIEIRPDAKFLANRQQARVESGLRALNAVQFPASPGYTDGQLRLVCLLAWGLFRDRFSLEGLDNLQAALETIDNYPPFADTKPFV